MKRAWILRGLKHIRGFPCASIPTPSIHTGLAQCGNQFAIEVSLRPSCRLSTSSRHGRQDEERGEEVRGRIEIWPHRKARRRVQQCSRPRQGRLEIKRRRYVRFFLMRCASPPYFRRPTPPFPLRPLWERKRKSVRAGRGGEAGEALRRR